MSDYSIKGYSWKCSDGAETTDVWKASPAARAATRPVTKKLRELERMASFKGNLFKPAFTYNFKGYPRHHPINLAAFPQRHVDFDMHSIEPGYGFPLHLHDYADENYLVIGGKGKIVIEGKVLDAEIHDVFYIPPGKWHCAFNPAGNTEVFHLFIFQTPRVSDELSELGYVEITKSQWDQLGLPKKKWELQKKRR
jgi:mannose-6-phosphate isomerase-like protein (cupin superfamily)